MPILAAFDYSGQSSAGLLVSCFLSFSLLFGPAGSGQDSFRSYFFPPSSFVKIFAVLFKNVGKFLVSGFFEHFPEDLKFPD